MWNNLPFWMKWLLFVSVTFGIGAIVYILQPKEKVESALVELTAFYRDVDGDGYGNPNVFAKRETAPSGHVPDNTDCRDDNPATYPGAEEVCDGRDNDCDGEVDEGLEKFAFYFDGDGDGHGEFDNAEVACRAPNGFVETADDPDDQDPNVPGS